MVGHGQRRAEDGGPRILVCCAAGYTNVGDDAILEGLVGLIRRRVPDARIAVACGPYGRMAERLGCEAVALECTPELVAAIAASDIVVYGGGGLFYDCGYVPSPDMIAEPRPPWLFFGLKLALYCRTVGVPMYICGVGVGPINTEVGSRALSMVAELASGWSVRDAMSAELLRSHTGVENAIQSYCPALCLSLADGEPNRRPDRPYVAVSLGVCGGAVPVFARLADAVIGETGLRVIFVAQQVYVDNGIRWAGAVRREMKGRASTEVMVARTPQEAMRVLAGAEVVFANRLHAAMLATNVGTPWVGFSTHDKTIGFAQHLKWPFAYRSTPESLDRALGDGLRLLADRETYSRMLRRLRTELIGSLPGPEEVIPLDTELRPGDSRAQRSHRDHEMQELIRRCEALAGRKGLLFSFARRIVPSCCRRSVHVLARVLTRGLAKWNCVL
jgi:polysaccharide pyruvyl transferase WcaK-like protein